MDYWRQNGIVSQDDLNKYPFTLIGAGGIGSVVALELAKMGVQDLTVYDPDIVEPHNLPNQLYRLFDIGRPKVESLADNCWDFAGLRIKPVQSEFPLTTKPDGIIICGVDSMAARRAIWERAIFMNPRVRLYVEARMGAQEGRVYTASPLSRTYQDSLYGDDEASELACTARAISFNVFFLAGLIGSEVRKFVTGARTSPEIIFDLVSNTVLCPQ